MVGIQRPLNWTDAGYGNCPSRQRASVCESAGSAHLRWPPAAPATESLFQKPIERATRSAIGKNLERLSLSLILHQQFLLRQHRRRALVLPAANRAMHTTAAGSSLLRARAARVNIFG